MSSADIILHNARVITLDKKHPAAELVAIKSNRILGIGPESAFRSFNGTKTEIIDCRGRTIVPGFNDAHCHSVGFANHLLSVDCGPSAVSSIAEIKERIRERASRTPEGKLIRGDSYNKFYFTEKRHPNRWDLDEAAPNHPVKLIHYSGHAIVLNSLALRIAGISSDTPEPPGAVIERDLKTGEPNGLLFEMTPYIEKILPSYTEEDQERGMAMANEVFISLGITSLLDATRGEGLRRLQKFRRIKERGILAPRILTTMGPEDMDEALEKGFLQSCRIENQLNMGGIKISLLRTTGSLDPTQEEMNRLACKANEAGLQLVIHAVEEFTVEAAIIALEHALRQFPRKDHRHRIEHCSVCPPPLTQRIKNIQAMVVTQPAFIYYSGERYLKTMPPEDLRWLYAIGSLRGNNIRVATGSDGPVVPFDPLKGIYAAVTRRAETRQIISPEEGIGALEALKMCTLDAAYASFEEKVKGSITPGKLADLVVLSDDPARVPPEEIKDITVLMTMIDGKVVWKRS